MTDDRPYDLVLVGATGFVGRLTAEYLARTAPHALRVALAGRSRERLEALRADLPRGPGGAGGASWAVVDVDVHDGGAVAELARSTRVVVSTVGPYLRHGLALVGACAAAGTHYADLTGEVLFVRASADAFHDVARRSGARIVHSCGFDSVPSDLAVLLAARRAAADGAGELATASLVVRSLSGGVSGGTLASFCGQLDAVRDRSELREVITDPYALSPDRAAEADRAAADRAGGDRGRVGRPRIFFHAGLRTWVLPFFMGPFNTKVVRRSNALLDHDYGRDLRYRELHATGRGLRGLASAVGIATVLLAGGAAMRWAPTRRLLDRVLPTPGEGPDERTRNAGHLRLELYARTTRGVRYRVDVAAQGDPGYAATAVMLGEAGLALALDGPRLPEPAGVLTPAAGIGVALADRLRGAGFTLSVRRDG